MGRLYHIPQAITQRHSMWTPTPKTPPSDSAELLRLCDAVALSKFGVPALLLSVAERELLLLHIGNYLMAQDAAESAS